MSRYTAQVASTVLGIAGTLLFVSIGFHIMPSNMAIFSGIACFVMAGGVWSLVRGAGGEE